VAVVNKCSDIAEVSTACIFRVTELFQADAEVIRRKKMCRSYLTV
jgi:hypothetical protein